MSQPELVRVSAAIGAGLRSAQRSWVASLAGAAVLIGSYFALVLGHGALYGYDFFDEPAPSDVAETTIGLLLLGYFAVALYGVTVFYGAVAVMAREDVSTRVAVRRAVSRLWRDVWWVVPAMFVAVLAAIFIVPGPFVIAPFAMLGAARVNRVRMRAGAVSRSYWRLFAVALVPTGLVLLVWVGGFLVGDAPSPPTWLAAVLCTVVAWLSFVTMAITAGAAVELIAGVEMRPATWGPPLSAGSWAPPAPPTPTPRPVQRTPFPKARIAWIVLFALASVLFMIGSMAMMGDPYPLSRSGVLIDTNGLQVVNAVCPGDRLLRVELRDQSTIDEPGPVRWALEGDASLPTHLVIGQPIDGMRTTVPLGALNEDVTLEVFVEIEEIGVSNPIPFIIGELVPSRIETDRDMFDTYAEFERSTKDDVPCGDPLQKGRRGSVMAVFAAIAGALLLVAAVFGAIDVMGVRRRARATMR